MKDSILSALVLASRVNKGLGKSLTQRVIGEKADVVTKGDMEIGEKIIKTLLISKPQIVVESEEKGKESNLGPGEQERFYVAIDDIDGTNNLRVGNGLLPYCSMIVAFDGSKKTEAGYKYSDYTHAACIDYSRDKIFYTEKGLGKVEVYDTGWNKITDSSEIKQDNSNLALTLSADVVSTQRGGTTGYAKSPVANVSIFPGLLDAVYNSFAIVDSGCSVFEYAMVGMGIRNGYVSSGKKQHELPLLYAFAKETGQQMVDFDGNYYDNKTYDFKGGNAEVVAGDPKVIADVLKKINFQKQAIARVQDLIRSTGSKGPASAAMTRKRWADAADKQDEKDEQGL